MDNYMNSSEIQPHVLIIEHDPELRKIMKLSLEQFGMTVETTGRYTNAMQVLERKPPDLFLVDFDLRGGEAGKLIQAYRENPGSSGVVMVTTTSRLTNDWRQKHKPDSVIYKPFDIRYLIRLISLLTEKETVPS